MDIVCSLDSDCTIPLMQLVDKSERSIVVNGIDSNHTFWIQFINDDINVFMTYYSNLLNIITN